MKGVKYSCEQRSLGVLLLFEYYLHRKNKADSSDQLFIGMSPFALLRSVDFWKMCGKGFIRKEVEAEILCFCTTLLIQILKALKD